VCGIIPHLYTYITASEIHLVTHFAVIQNMIIFALKSMNNTLQHNSEVKASAEFRAREMKLYPSPLEIRMMDFLDSNGIFYETQKIFYIYATDRWIIRYYIVDFFIPKNNIVIEVDGKFHDKQKQHDKDRTKAIQEQYPWIEVLRYRWKDLSDENIMRELLNRIK